MNKALFWTGMGTSAALIFAVVVIPYQISQQIQLSLFGEPINAPIVIQPAYATGAITDIFLTHSDNLMGIKSYYYFKFTGSTASETGNAKTIEFQFPSGFNVAGAKVMPITESFEGVTSVSGQTVIFTLNSPQHANMVWRFSLSDVVNGFSALNQIGITIKDQSGTIVDGPANSPTFTLTPITSPMLANNAVTTDKINRNAVTNSKIMPDSIDSSKIQNGKVMKDDLAANSVDSSKIIDDSINGNDISPLFMKHVVLGDDSAGHAAGWNPDSGSGNFDISDSAVSGTNSIIILNMSFSLPTTDENNCSVNQLSVGSFHINCHSAPRDGSILSYLVLNL